MAKLTQQKRDNASDDKFAFPKEEKEPLNDAAHVRNAIARFNIARFNQAGGGRNGRRAGCRVETCPCRCEKIDVAVKESDWRKLSHHGKKTSTAQS